jgi:hypothetical protein
MKLIIENPDDNAVTLFRRAGYTFQREESGEVSFIRPLGRSGYPRFHCYTKSHGTGIECGLHLDQKRETYGRATRHHGEYEEVGALAEELLRIESIIGKFTRID